MGLLLAEGPLDDNVHNPLCGLTVPEFWDSPAPAPFSELRLYRLCNDLFPQASQKIRSFQYRYRSFGVGSDGDARDPQTGRLFLDATRIRQYKACILQKAKK